tara:strand:- start:3065 stop:3628 length:564 start_codon:yes stop_codon:yes gene_type:complete
MGSSGSKVTCDSEKMKTAFKGISCTEDEVQIANDLYKYFHLADKQWVGMDQGSDGCGLRKTYEDNPNYADEKKALEQALLTKLTKFFNNRTTESVRNIYKPKLYKVIENIKEDITSAPLLPFFCVYTSKKGSTRTRKQNVATESFQTYMFHIQDKINFVTNIIDGMFPSLAGEIEEPLDKVQPTIKF